MAEGTCSGCRVGFLTTISSLGVLEGICVARSGILQTTRKEWLEQMVSGEKLRAALEMSILH